MLRSFANIGWIEERTMDAKTRPVSLLFTVVVLAAATACGPGPSQGADIVLEPDTDSPAPDSGPSEDTSSDTGMDTSGGGDTSSPTVDEVDPNCVDGKYSEPLPDPGVDISSETSSYDSSRVKSFIDSVLDKRYPVGRWLVSQALQKGDSIDCVERFLRDTSSASSVLNTLSTVVHECGHVYDQAVSSFGSSTYKITRDVSFSCPGGDTTDRRGNTFARSRIKNDQYQSEHPPCDGSRGRNCDSYADIYLDGDPDNDTFEGGDQGFNSVLEETLQYVNSLATAYAFQDQLGRRSTSAMDGILTFLWYTERYLRMARQDYPDAYSHLTGSSCWRKAILTVWGRAWLMLKAAKSNDQLGIAEQKLFQLVRTPELLKEIERIRQKHGCRN
ncbi:MAG: hypothetical protein ABEN55_19955 [Bradymonadaceae bacterium]